jgi:hypothetical protein
MQEKNRLFFKKFKIPHKPPLTAEKAPFISTKPAHQQSGIEHQASRQLIS